MDDVFGAVQSVFGGSVALSSSVGRTRGSKISLLVFGFFVLIFISTYTAVVVNQLLNTNQIGDVNSVQECIDQQKKICLMRAFKGEFEAKYPDAQPLVVSLGTVSEPTAPALGQM